MLRRVILGPYALGALGAYGEILNKMPGLDRLPPIDIHGIFYSTLVQAGATSFDVFGAPDEVKLSVESSTFLAERVRFAADGKWGRFASPVRESLERFLPDKYYLDGRYEEVTCVLAFFETIAVAVQQNQSAIAMTLPLPDLERLKVLIPQELLVPLANFLSTMTAQQVQVPLPTHVVSVEDFQRLKDIITSDLFSQYIESHTGFERISRVKGSTAARVTRSGLRLAGSQADILRLKTLAVNLIPITSKVVSTAFGSLPGSVSEFFGDLLSSWIKGERQIVIYHFDGTIKELLWARLHAAYPELRKKPPNRGSPWG